ncbi:retrovirus-related pol polyprotein from transposon TNT 1-94 [Tanacetum coccineum]
MLFTIPSWKQVNPPYKFKWTEKTVPVAEGSSKTTTEGYMENYKNVSQDIRDQPNAKAEAVQIILTGIDNDIYSIVDACPNACEMWKAIERLKQGESINVQDLETNLYWEFRKFTSWDGESLESYYLRSQQAATKNKGKEIVNSPPLTYDQEPDMVTEDDALSKTSSSTSRAHQDNTPRINRGTRYDNQRAVYVAGARENELEAHYMYMAQIQEVTRDAADNSRPIFDTNPLLKLKFLGTVKFRNDQIALILGYGDLVQGNITIKIKGLNHNLFSVGQLCDANLEVSFRKSTCYIYDLKGNDLLTGSRGTDLYSITLQNTSTPNPICLMAKATSSQAWLWHHHHLCSSCELGKAKRKSFHTKTTPSSKRQLRLLHMDLCGPIGLHAQVRTMRTDRGTEFLNKTLHAYFAKESIEHETSTARTPEQNGVVERRNRTLVEPARTMLSAAKVPFSLCYIVRDGENLDKMKEKGNACIFVGYSTQSRAYQVYNKITIVIVETIYVNFDELPLMASDHVSSDPIPQCLTTALEHDSLSPGPESQENVPQLAATVTMSNELDLLFSLMFAELLNGTTPVVS